MSPHTDLPVIRRARVLLEIHGSFQAAADRLRDKVDVIREHDTLSAGVRSAMALELASLAAGLAHLAGIAYDLEREERALEVEDLEEELRRLYSVGEHVDTDPTPAAGIPRPALPPAFLVWPLEAVPMCAHGHRIIVPGTVE